LILSETSNSKPQQIEKKNITFAYITTVKSHLNILTSVDHTMTKHFYFMSLANLLIQ